MTATTILPARDLRAGDRIHDGGSQGRVVKRARTLKNGRVRVRWIDGWDDTFAPDEPFAVRERDVAWAK